MPKPKLWWCQLGLRGRGMVFLGFSFFWSESLLESGVKKGLCTHKPLLLNWVVVQSSHALLVSFSKPDSLSAFWLGWPSSSTLMSSSLPKFFLSCGPHRYISIHWELSNGIQLLLYDCQLLGLRDAMLNLVLVKQLVQGTDIECVILVYRLLVWPLNPWDWQGLPNCGEK